MRLVLQRVTRAVVRVDGKSVGSIGTGLMVLAGFGRDDGYDLPVQPEWAKMVDKVCNLRVFPDSSGKLNQSLVDAAGELLLVSQFTLYADCLKGRRPSFTGAAPPEVAEKLYDELINAFMSRMPGKVAQGVFGAPMEVDFCNWGPVTVILDSQAFSKSARR